MKRSRIHSFEAPCNSAGVLSLNVGGTRFQMSKETAAQIPYFKPYLEGRFNLIHDEEGWIFVDRCGELFKHIVQFARDARRPARRILEALGYALQAECDFFGCDALAHHLREETSYADLRPEDRRIREEELIAQGEDSDGALIDFFAMDHSPLEREGLQMHLLLDEAPRAAVTRDFTAFYERLKEFSGGILADLVRVPGVIVAGGAVVGALVDAPSSDLDLFLVCSAAEADLRLKEIYNIVQQSLRARYGSHAKLLVTRSAAAITLHHCMGAESVGTPPVQVVLGLGRSAADVLQRFDVDCCCVGFDPVKRKVLCTRRGLRAIRFGANIVDSAFGGLSYARRLQKYATRGFAAAVPYFSSERASPELWRWSYTYFEHSGLLLRLGRYAAASAVVRRGILISACRHATAVDNLARLVVLDAGAPTVNYCHNDRIRGDTLVSVPLPTGETGEYIVATGWATAPEAECDLIPEESDLYYSLAGFIPGLLEKACRVDGEHEDSATPDGWHTGGVVRRSAEGGLTAVAGAEESTAAFGHEHIVCVYDLVACGAEWDSLRYVIDARQLPLSTMTPDCFERRHGFPAAVLWRPQKPRARLREFTRGVYV